MSKMDTALTLMELTEHSKMIAQITKITTVIRATQENKYRKAKYMDPTGMIGRLPKEVMTKARAEEQARIKQMSGDGEWMGRILSVQETAMCNFCKDARRTQEMKADHCGLNPERVGKGQTMRGLVGHDMDFDLYTGGSGKL